MSSHSAWRVFKFYRSKRDTSCYCFLHGVILQILKSWKGNCCKSIRARRWKIYFCESCVERFENETSGGKFWESRMRWKYLKEITESRDCQWDFLFRGPLEKFATLPNFYPGLLPRFRRVHYTSTVYSFKNDILRETKIECQNDTKKS